MKHDFLDHHSHGNSLIHGLDARVKIFIFILFGLYAVSYSQLLSIRTLILFLGLMILLLLTGVHPFHIIAKYLRIIWIVILMTILLPFQQSDEILVSLFGLIIYKNGLLLQITIIIRSSILVMGLILLTLSTPFNTLLSALRWFLIPVAFINLLTFVYRFLFIFIDEMERLLVCWKSRYIVLPITKRFYYLANLVGALFIRAIERSETIYIAMKSRGYSGKIFIAGTPAIKAFDILFLIIFFTFFMAMVYL